MNYSAKSKSVPGSDALSLEAHYIEQIRQAARAKFPEIERIKVFGSRALKTAKPGSDIDLAIEGRQITRTTRLNFHDYLNNESTIPYKIDVVHTESATNNDLIEHIRNHGLIIYEAG